MKTCTFLSVVFAIGIIGTRRSKSTKYMRVKDFSVFRVILCSPSSNSS